MRMNNAIFRSGNIQNVISIDANSIQNTEVILGPGTVIYGSDAIGGVMNFYTFEPEYAKEHPFYSGNALSRWSSANNEKTIHFDLNVGTSKWAFVTSATFSDFEDLKMGKHGPRAYIRPDYVQTIDNVDEIITNPNPNKQVVSGYSQVNLLQKIAFKPNDYWNFIYALHYSSTSDFNRYDQLLRRRNDQLRFAEWYYGPQEWTMHHLKISHSKPNKWFDKAQFNASYQLFEESRHNRNFNSSIRNSNIENVNAFSSTFDFIKKLNQRQKLSYGIEYILNDINSVGFQKNVLTDEKEAIPSRYPDGSSWQSLATYVQYENKLTNKFTFQSGLRFNQIWLDATFDNTFVDYPFDKTEINTSAFTGSIGFTYLASDKTALFFNTGTAFRSPNIDDIGKTYESTPGNVVVPNPDLEYEYAYNFEIGVQQKIGKSITLDVTGFYTIVEDALVRRPFTFNGEGTIVFQGEESNVQAIQNAAKANVYGLQGGLNVELSPILNWKTNANWTKGEEELDNGNKAPLRHAAPFFGDSRLLLKTRKWITDLSVIFNSKIKAKNLAPSEVEKDYLYAFDGEGKPYVPSWYTLNLKAIYKLDENWSFSGGLENITDQRYRPYSSGITAAGRNLILAVRTSF
ncbi:MAG: TonB-dependent receptor [Flavobacterium sp.]|nr:TonB-dependent receptor [Flavobacterium sp.]